MEARRAHNPEAVGSNPAPATIKEETQKLALLSIPMTPNQKQDLGH